MKQINFLKYAFILTLFIYTTACDKEDTIEGSIPEKVHTGFNNKFPNAINIVPTLNFFIISSLLN